MCSFLKSIKLYKSVNPKLWETILCIRFDYNPDGRKEEPSLSKNEKELLKLRDLKRRHKISKRQEKILNDLEVNSKKVSKKHADNKKIEKQVRKDLRKSEGAMSEGRKHSLAKQLLMKLFYFSIKVIREFSNEKILSVALRTIKKYLSYADTEFITEVLEDLKTSYSLLSSSSNQLHTFASQKMAIIDTIIEISQKFS